MLKTEQCAININQICNHIKHYNHDELVNELRKIQLDLLKLVPEDRAVTNVKLAKAVLNK
jgi:hypothetical protein